MVSQGDPSLVIDSSDAITDLHHQNYYYLFASDSWSISQTQSNTTRAQKWLGIAHYRVYRSLHTTNTERSNTLSQRPNYSVIQSSSYRDQRWAVADPGGQFGATSAQTLVSPP